MKVLIPYGAGILPAYNIGRAGGPPHKANAPVSNQ